MPGLNGVRSRRRWASAVLATVLYLVSAVAVPVLHARTEVLSSVAEVESGPSAQCARIHTEATCPVCGAFQLPSPPLRAFAEAPADHVCAIGHTNHTFTPHTDPSPHPVRAPPAR